MNISKKQLVGALIFGAIALIFWSAFAEELDCDVKYIEFAFSWTVKTIGLFSIILGFFNLLKVESKGNLEAYIPATLFILVGISIYTLSGVAVLGVSIVASVLIFTGSTN